MNLKEVYRNINKKLKEVIEMFGYDKGIDFGAIIKIIAVVLIIALMVSVVGSLINSSGDADVSSSSGGEGSTGDGGSQPQPQAGAPKDLNELTPENMVYTPITFTPNDIPSDIPEEIWIKSRPAFYVTDISAEDGILKLTLNNIRDVKLSMPHTKITINYAGSVDTTVNYFIDSSIHLGPYEKVELEFGKDTLRLYKKNGFEKPFIESITIGA